MTLLEDILIKTAKISIDVLNSDWYGGINIGATLANYYLADKSSNLNNTTVMVMVALAIDSIAWPWLNDRTLHSHLGLNPGYPYEAFIYLYERLALGSLNVFMVMKNIYDLTRKI